MLINNKMQIVIMQIRKAAAKDFEQLYKIGSNTPELQVSATEPFMDEDDFKLRIKDKNHVFLLAEADEKIVGFVCANTKDIDRPMKNKYACLVYIVVIPSYRKKGVANKLYNSCTIELKKKGITHVYTWANDSPAIKKFLKSKRFSEGGKYIWMDKKL